ncbi:MAG: class I SAM-dependent methyltransferase [Tepidiformaceae bacterium]
MTTAMSLCKARDYRPFPNHEWRNRLQASLEVPAMARALSLPQGGRVLEVGCGRGIALEPLSRACRPRELAAIDIEPDLVAEALRSTQSAGVQVDLRTADVRSLPFADASFDIVVDFGTSYHVARREAALREVARVLAVGGLYVYESPLGQAAAHPNRTTWRRLPWAATPELVPARRAGLWSARVKVASI